MKPKAISIVRRSCSETKNPENKFVGFVLEGHGVSLSGDKVVLDGEALD